jgi:hypothetical protein
MPRNTAMVEMRASRSLKGLLARATQHLWVENAGKPFVKRKLLAQATQHLSGGNAGEPFVKKRLLEQATQHLEGGDAANRS